MKQDLVTQELLKDGKSILAQLVEIQQAIGQRFPVEDHDERILPGGSKWWFVRWQRQRERLDQVAPFANVSYSVPAYLGDDCVITCSIEILGVTKQGVGCVPIKILSSSGKDASRGSAVDRAVAEAFKNSMEAWGCTRYLDDQADDRTKRDFLTWMQRQGNGKAIANYHAANQPPRSPRPTPQHKPFGGAPASSPAKLEAVPDQPQRIDTYPNIKRVGMWKEWTGLSAANIKQIRLSAGLPDLAEMTDYQMIQLRSKVFAYWGRLRCFNSLSHAENALSALGDADSDESLMTAWRADIDRRLAEKNKGEEAIAP